MLINLIMRINTANIVPSVTRFMNLLILLRFFCPFPPDIFSFREHAGVEGSFKMSLKKLILSRLLKLRK